MTPEESNSAENAGKLRRIQDNTLKYISLQQPSLSKELQQHLSASLGKNIEGSGLNLRFAYSRQR
jgi:hypothetical protein